MNVLILTAKFGLGHIKTAEAIKEELMIKDKNVNVEIVDLISYLFPKTSKAIYMGFNFMVSKCSGLYNYLNKSASKHGGVPLKVAITKKIDTLIETHKADAIVVVFSVCSQYISAYKTIRRCNIPMYTYITDITAHEEWIAKETTLYFVGDETTKNTLISKGVEEARVVVSGIPVRQSFKKPVSKLANQPSKEVLIMGGGLGLLPNCDALLEKLSKENNIKVNLIAGTNKGLYDKMKKDYSSFNVIGYTNKVDEYMRSASLIISKAGGITTFEAINCETPMYVIKPFLEQEYGNSKFIEEHNMGRVLWNDQINPSEDIIQLLRDGQLLDKMSDNMKKMKESYESTDLFTIINERGLEKCS